MGQTDNGQQESIRLRTEGIDERLQARNDRLEALTENIPGGVHQCECNQEMTILSMSRSFLALVGYSVGEIEQRFHNHFAEMIYPPDLARIQTEMEEQLSCGDVLEIEYRILQGDGNLLWIMDQGRRVTQADGRQTFYCMLMDITKQKKERDELRLSLERHQIIMDQSTDIIFEWDIEKDALIFSANWRKKFGYDAIHEDISRNIPLSNNIHPDDMPAFIKIMRDSAAGIPYSETEFRIRDILGNYIWNRIRATVQYDMHGQPVRVVGVILDIDLDKKQRLRLLDQAQRDALTGLYNKSAVRELIEKRMREGNADKKQALLIIDVDNFKRVNDIYGHLCGDSLLLDVAGVLKKSFRSNDLLGRIGGDEFLVYLPDIAGQKETAEKTRNLLDTLHTLKPCKDAPPISCSIGIALFPQKGADYFALYKCADTALYQIKAHEKNNFCFYDPNTCEGIIPCGLSHSAVGTIDSEAEKAVDATGEKLAHYTFQMLYDSIDVNTAVSKLLEIVGRAYEVSRVYVFETSEDGRFCSNTFEWCNTGVKSQLANLQNLSFERDLVGFLDVFDENGMFYCPDVKVLNSQLQSLLEAQGVVSVLQCFIKEDGCFKGYVGFDECRENRRWTKEQINSLTLISNVLSTFLLKLRLKEKLEQKEK